jgi:hypothetical protein
MNPCCRRPSCGWVCSLVERWLVGSSSSGPVSLVLPACGFRKTVLGVGVGGWSHCWVLRERAPPGLRFAGLVGFVSSGAVGCICRVGGCGLGVRAGLAAIPHRCAALGCSGWWLRWLVVVVGWCPFVF